jgi:hypothetical protein
MKDFGYIREQRAKCDRTGKTCFDKKSAVTAKNKREREDHETLRIYECPHCGAWHLTHQEYSDFYGERSKKGYR